MDKPLLQRRLQIGALFLNEFTKTANFLWLFFKFKCSSSSVLYSQKLRYFYEFPILVLQKSTSLLSSEYFQCAPWSTKPQQKPKSKPRGGEIGLSVWAPLSLRHSFNLLCSSEVHLHACLCKLQFLLNRTLNCRHMLEWSRCPSEAKWVTAAQHRLFWNQQQPCQAPTLSSPGCKPEPSPSHGHQHQMAEPVTELLERKKMASRNENSREEMREKSEIEKRGWNAFVFSLIIRFLNSNGCGWICIA